MSETAFYTLLSLVADLLNVYLPEDYIRSQVERIRASTDRYGLERSRDYVDVHECFHSGQSLHASRSGSENDLARLIQAVRKGVEGARREVDGQPLRHSDIRGLRQYRTPRVCDWRGAEAVERAQLVLPRSRHGIYDVRTNVDSARDGQHGRRHNALKSYRGFVPVCRFCSAKVYVFGSSFNHKYCMHSTILMQEIIGVRSNYFL